MIGAIGAGGGGAARICCSGGKVGGNGGGRLVGDSLLERFTRRCVSSSIESDIDNGSGSLSISPSSIKCRVGDVERVGARVVGRDGISRLLSRKRL